MGRWPWIAAECPRCLCIICCFLLLSFSLPPSSTLFSKQILPHPMRFFFAFCSSISLPYPTEGSVWVTSWWVPNSWLGLTWHNILRYSEQNSWWKRYQYIHIYVYMHTLRSNFNNCFEESNSKVYQLLWTANKPNTKSAYTVYG